MDSKFYKYCAVPLCHNTTIRTPQKLFVHVPKQKEIRKQWFQLARRDKPLTAQNVYYCEDHFDMPNDMENFMEYHIMGTTSQIRMKPGCLPTKFHCQPDRKRVSVLNKPTTAKRQRKYLIEECLKKEEDSVVLQRNDESSEVPSGSSEVQQPEVQQQPTGDKKINIGVQFNFRSKYRSKYTQTELNLRTKQTSPIKISSTSVSTSPFKIYPLKPNVKAKPSRSNAQKLFKECDGSDRTRSSKPLDVIHADVCGPMEITSIGGSSKQQHLRKMMSQSQ
ncbi:hypothetical protein PYW08_012277 [Mythimna loreyi]|uniref:Uncharacterized protein n=1 Tax=Mythimna loreyi TaxID=667449 RepID=A0ACC2Q1K7_9NEOP|nr:hypothetical protein PYW08_012277 [Mythimna loreyi]